MKVFLYIALVFCVFSCKDAAKTPVIETETEETSSQITKEDISALKYDQFILDRKRQNSDKFWQKYTELDEIVLQVQQADFSFFKGNNEILNAFIKDLKESLPSEFDTPHIQARLVALETKMLKLEGVMNLSNPKKKEVLLVLRDFLSAFSNLNLQMNKKIERESQNIQKP